MPLPRRSKRSALTDGNIMTLINFELERIFTNKKNLIWLLLLFLITIYFTNVGITDYRNFINDKKAFSNFEKERAKSFATYSQYYAFGFRLFYQPSKLLIFFRNSNIFQNIESNIDGSEIIKVYNPKKGKSIADRGNFKDFAGVFFLLGSLLMIYTGSISFINSSFLKCFMSKKNIFLSIIIRLILLNAVFVFILTINYAYARLRGISFSQEETTIFISYGAYTLIFLSFFYLTGTFISAIFKSKKTGLVLTVWIVLILGIPEINNNSLINRIAETPNHESLNLKKLKALMEMEKDTQKRVLQILKENKNQEEIKEIHKNNAFKFYEDVYQGNKKTEAEYNHQVSMVIRKYEKESIIIPTSYYRFFTGEISSMGYAGYFDFLDYISKLREEFFTFYLNRRYDSTEKDVEHFVKGEENIFRARSRLPETFTGGLAITLLYTLILFAASCFLLFRKLKVRRDIEDPKLTAEEDEEGKMYFALCKNDKTRNEIAEFYRGSPNTVCVDNIKGCEIDPGLSPANTFKYFCRFKGVDAGRAAENLEILGIKDLSKEKRSCEMTKKIYCAVCFAKDAAGIVIDDFIDRESRDFERKFLDLIEHALEGERTIIYLSAQIYYFDSPFTGDIKMKKFKKFRIEKPSAITIR